MLSLDVARTEKWKWNIWIETWLYNFLLVVGLQQLEWNLNAKLYKLLCIFSSVEGLQTRVPYDVKTKNLPVSTIWDVFEISSPSFTRGVAGITRKNESILLMLPSFLFKGTESERDICFRAPFLCKRKFKT